MDFLLDLTIAQADHADRLRQADAARRAQAATASPRRALDQSRSGRWPAASTLLAPLASVWSLLTAVPPRAR